MEVSDEIMEIKTSEQKAENTSNEISEDTVNYKEKYRTLKRKLKALLYEQECFHEELRRVQRKCLRVSRDKSFLLDKLLQFEKPDMLTSDSEATDTSSDGEADTKEKSPIKKSNTSKQNENGNKKESTQEKISENDSPRKSLESNIDESPKKRSNTNVKSASHCTPSATKTSQVSSSQSSQKKTPSSSKRNISKGKDINQIQEIQEQSMQTSSSNSAPDDNDELVIDLPS